MARLIFKADDVRRVVEHSIAAQTQREQVVDFDKDGKAVTVTVTKPAVLLVHDDGVYLMSNGEPRDIIACDDGKGGGRSFCAYAQGCDPRMDPDSWDTARDLVGDDDFAETLPWAQALLGQLNRGAKAVVINMTRGSVVLGTPKF